MRNSGQGGQGYGHDVFVRFSAQPDPIHRIGDQIKINRRRPAGYGATRRGGWTGWTAEPAFAVGPALCCLYGLCGGQARPFDKLRVTDWESGEGKSERMSGRDARSTGNGGRRDAYPTKLGKTGARLCTRSER